ncbi:MAG: beta-propeller domain-containing protein, partial [Eubacteriales bacterium]|nr:beta-propeller domain-containing protein [Eubacteriales bacterium]
MSIWKNYKNDMDRQQPSAKAVSSCKIEAESRYVQTKRKSAGRRIPSLACAAALLIVASLTFSFIFGATGGNPIVNGNDTGVIKKVADYTQLYNELSSRLSSGSYYYSDKNAVGAPTEGAETDDSASNGDYSDTNLQVAGVQEADIVKTDGSYIYAVSDSFIYIVKAENGRLTLVSKINTAEISGQDDQNGYSYSYAGDIYVTPTRLIVMKNVYSYGIYDKNGDTDYGYTEPVPETDYAG